MCGFAGSLFFTKRYTALNYKDWSFKCSSLLEHRGPDAEGFNINNFLSLTARRLRIHDLNSNADQPFEDKNKKYLVAFNGAIFNYRELQYQLKQKGVQFQTDSDTEVVMYALSIWGEEALNKFDGMYSIFFYDRTKENIIIARDKLGIKPLYYFVDNEMLVFSSEIKPIIAHPLVKKEFNVDFVSEFFAFQNLMPPNTFFKNIKILEPGQLINVQMNKNKKFKIQTYWSLEEFISIKNHPKNMEDAISDSLKNCWNADRDVGIQLSGGVDSSLVTAVSVEKLNIKKINTFSVIFNDQNIKYYYPRSEEKFIDYVTKKYNTNSNKYLFDANSIKSSLVESIWFHEMPLNGPSTSLYLLLAKKIKDKTTVLITGEGADDIFLGYFSRWKFNDIKTFYKQFVNKSYLNLLFGKKKSLTAIAGRNELLENQKVKNMSAHDKATLITMKVYLHGLLARHDRMFMASGIEGRLPFCSDLVLKTRFGLTDKLVQDENEGKVILKKLASQYYPNDFVYRKKIGFSSPFGDWCSSPKYWRNYYENLDKDFIGYISNPDFLSKHKLMNEGKEKWSGQNLNTIFNYINVSLWYRIFFESDDFTKSSAWENIVEQNY